MANFQRIGDNWNIEGSLSATTFYGDGSNLTGITGGGTFTGGTVSGATQFTGGLTANTISATTYQNLPVAFGTDNTNIKQTDGTNSNTSNAFASAAFNANNQAKATNSSVFGSSNVINIGSNNGFIAGGTNNQMFEYNGFIGGADGSVNRGANSAILGGVSHTINTGVDNSVILGGSGITATTDNTVYTPNLVVSSAVTANTYYGDGSNLTGVGGGSFTGTTLSNMQYIGFNTTATTTHSEGRIHWNDNIKSMEIDTENANVQIQVGHQSVVRIYNGTGAILSKGTAVYITGEQGQRPSVSKADWTTDASSASVIGLVMADINNGANGYVITFGILEGLNTIAYSAGTPLYLFSGGTLTSTKPIAPNHDVRIGKVVVSNATTGSIFVNVQNGYELEELHDVQITGTTHTGEVLTYHSASNLWKPSFIPPMGVNEVFRGRTFRYDSTTVDTYGGIATLNNASALAIVPNTTQEGNQYTRIRYYASIVSTGRVTSIRSTDLQWYLGETGFRFVSTFRIADTAFGSTCQNFHGLIGTTSEIAVGGATNIQVSTLTNCIFVGSDGSDANLQVMHNDGSGTCTKVDLGASFPANRPSGSTSTDFYSIELYNQKDTTNVKYRVINLSTGAVAQGVLTTNLPANSQGLAIQSARIMGTPTTNTGQWEQHKWGCSDITN